MRSHKPPTPYRRRPNVLHPRVDARLLLAMLGLDGDSAELLREHGLDEAAVRGALGGP